MKGKAILIIIGVILCVTCRNRSTKSEGFVFPKTDSVPVSEAEKLSPEAIADISKHHAAKLAELPTLNLDVCISTEDARRLYSIHSNSIDYIFICFM